MYTKTVKGHMHSRSNNDKRKKIGLQYRLQLLWFLSGRTDFEIFPNKTRQVFLHLMYMYLLACYILYYLGFHIISWAKTFFHRLQNVYILNKN